MAALLIGGGTPAAFAACANNINASFDNPAAATAPCVAVTNTSFAGNITNEGTIAPGGITFTQGTITGFIASSGNIAGGLSLDNKSTISNAFGTAISLTGSTFLGGISNAGLVSAGDRAINVSVTTFGGGISNSGLISAGSGFPATGIGVGGVSVFSGGIDNGPNGTITASGLFSLGIAVQSVATFNGDITNRGLINVATAGSAIGIFVFGVDTFTGSIINSGSISAGAAAIHVADSNTFAGGISNSGNLSASFGGIIVSAVNVFGSAKAGGGIVNSGTITAGTNGIAVGGVATFLGGITNSGMITTSGVVGIRIEGLASLAGDISNGNGGQIAAARSGIRVGGVEAFLGGITNSGTITTTIVGSGAGILLGSIGSITGAIRNDGVIAAGLVGIGVAGVESVGNGITNAGLITIAQGLSGAGISVDHVSLFSGGIANSGTIMGAATGIAVGCGCGVSTFLGGISNSGVIAAAANGIVVGSALGSTISAFSGGITNSGTISGGTGGIVIANASFVDGHIVNSGTIAAATAIDLTGAANAITIDQKAGLVSGDIRLSPNGDTLNVSGGTISGNVVGQNAGDTVNFALRSGPFTYASPFAMTGLSLVNFTAGTAYIDGAVQAAAIDINSGGTAGGIGTLSGPVTVMQGGTLLPGDPVTPRGTLAVLGSLTFNAGSFYQVHISPGAGNNSATVVNGGPGTIQINGGTVVVAPQFGHYSATTYTIAHASSGLSGAFAPTPIFTGPLAFTGSATVRTDASLNEVDLDLSAGFVIFAAPGANQNQQNVINGINNFLIGGGSLPANFQNLANLSDPAFLNAMTPLSGENNAGFFQGAFQAGNGFLNLMVNPFLDGRFGSGGGFGAAMGFAADEPPDLPQAALAFASAMPVKARPMPATFEQRFSVWGAGYGGSGRVTGDLMVGSHNTTAHAGAFAAGIDYRMSPDTMLGIALAGGGTSWDLTGGLGGGHSDMFQAGAYASHHWGAAYVSGAVAYNFHDVTTNRTVTVAGTDMLTSRFQANGVGARIEGGYRYATPWLGVTPYAAAQVQSIALPGYGETATAGSNQFALNFASQTATTTRTELGAWLDKSTRLDSGALLTLYGRAAWAHDFGNGPSASAIFQALPGSNFIVNGAVPARDGALVTGAAQYILASGWSFLAKFDGEFSSTTSVYSGSGMVRKTW